MAGVKARVATMLSLTGVLVAGSAAALVNTQVLRSTAPAGNTVSQLVEVSEDASTSSSVQVVTTPAPAPSSSATSSSTPTDDVKVYEVQNTGRVSLDTSKDVLRIVAVEPLGFGASHGVNWAGPGGADAQERALRTALLEQVERHAARLRGATAAAAAAATL